MINLTGLVWLIVFLVMLAIFQRRLHYEIQAILLVITRRADIALALFSLLFLPGVILHETSHFVSARLLGVRTGRFSIIPQPLPDGKLRMGYVETASTDIVRDSLIGSAPFFVGCLFVLYVALIPLGLASVWTEFIKGDFIVLTDAVGSMYKRPDFWLWFYLVFVVSSTMFPSASDRRAWFPLAIVVALVLIIGLLVWPGNLLTETWISISPKINIGVFALILIFGV
ncbi:MAG: hypothetical protein MUO67_03785, partial [Anaerolineales bacterium]|nr:hypothetical protein [Anaerolineales bacterium]